MRPLFAFVFYTAAWFAIEQRAIRNASGWALPDSYLDEEASVEGGLGAKETKILQLLRLEHPYASIAVLTDDIQSDKLSRVLPAARRGDGDPARVAAVTEWMRRRELSIYAAADASERRSHRHRARARSPSPLPLRRASTPRPCIAPSERRAADISGRLSRL